MLSGGDCDVISSSRLTLAEHWAHRRVIWRPFKDAKSRAHRDKARYFQISQLTGSNHA